LGIYMFYQYAFDPYYTTLSRARNPSVVESAECCRIRVA
jgi:hypothetical protein